MFEKFLSENAADFRQRYQGTFGFFRENGKQFLAKLTFVDGVVQFVDKRGIEFTLAPNRQDEVGFLFLPPKTGYSNTDEGAMYVERMAQRQFTRGISERNTRMYVIGNIGFAQVPVVFKYLEKVYDNKVPFKDSLEAFLSGKTCSLALNEQFMVENVKKKLYVFTSEIGTLESVTKDTMKLKLNEEAGMFQTELNDALRGYIKLEIV